MLLTQMQGEFLGLVAAGGGSIPVCGEFLAQAEEALERCALGVDQKLFPIVERGCQLRIDRLFEALSAVPGVIA